MKTFIHKVFWQPCLGIIIKVFLKTTQQRQSFELANKKHHIILEINLKML